MLPEDYLRKMKRALGEVEAEVEARTLRLSVLDDRPEYDFDQTPPPTTSRCLDTLAHQR